MRKYLFNGWFKNKEIACRSNWNWKKSRESKGLNSVWYFEIIWLNLILKVNTTQKRKTDFLFKYENFIASLFHLNNIQTVHTKGHRYRGEKHSEEDDKEEKRIFSTFDFNFHSFHIKSNNFQPLKFHPQHPQTLRQLSVSSFPNVSLYFTFYRLRYHHINTSCGKNWTLNHFLSIQSI